ncbi:helix-turn-helix transcriptional regulator [Brasilonema octagenarum]|uniref:helix-turn-helix transcriptional regulator n=1 Tax=Brasilonema octagenarum TaxID=417105 RepID=UPI00145EBAB4|nr:AraC family transcriptional regulator [Brasilonema octagenarum]
MTITITHQAYKDLWEKIKETTRHCDPSDPLDVIWKYPQQLGHGYIRCIELREGLEVEIFDCRLRNRLILELPERLDWLKFHFHLFGQHEDKHTNVGNKEYAVYGSGLAPKERNDGPEQRALEVTVLIHPDTLCSFISNPTGQLPTGLQQLIRPIEQECYTRVATVTSAMETVLWQILRCPYRGIPKRIFLESKALELVSLVLDQEIEIHTGDDRTIIQPLKPGTLDRIHYAQTLLQKNLHNPPSLVNLAQQAKLNECTLKRGFRQVFGTTVFGYLHNYRLEQARQLLAIGDMKVAEVAETVGFASRSYFAISFKKKFGLNPKDYQQQNGSVYQSPSP